MRAFFVILVAVLMLFTGVAIIHHQGAIRDFSFEKAPTLNGLLDTLTSHDKDLSLSYSVEPRSLID